MKRFHRRLVCSLGAAMSMAIAAGAAARSAPITDAGGHWTGDQGLTLYTYDPDGNSGQSHCDGPCAALWPPYLADPGAQPHADLGLTTRADNHLQWMANGHPLYRYAGDLKPGDHHGDGMNGTWHIALAH